MVDIFGRNYGDDIDIKNLKVPRSTSILANHNITTTIVAETNISSHWVKNEGRGRKRKYCEKCVRIIFQRDVSEDATKNVHLETMPGFKITWNYVGEGIPSKYFYDWTGGHKWTLGWMYTYDSSWGLTKAFVRNGSNFVL